MKVERTKNTGRNVIWGVANQIIVLGFPFIIRTIMIWSLGTNYLGLNGLFSSVIQMLNLTELGFSAAIVYSLYKPIAEDDETTVSAYLAYYRKVYKIIGFIILAAGLILTPFLPFFVKKDVPEEINIYILYIIYIVNTAVSYLLFAYKECLLTAHQRNDVISRINILVKTGLYTAQIIVLVFLKNYYCYTFLMLLSTVINSVLVSHFVSQMYPGITCKGDLSKTQKVELQKQVRGLMVSKIAATTRNSFDNIIISAAIGLTAVGVYSNYYYIISSVQGIMLIFCNSMQAGVGNSVAIESVDKNYQDCKNFTYIYQWIAGIAFVCIMTFYQPFMRIWTGEENMLPFGMVILMSVYFYLLTVGDIPSIYINATGIWDKYKAKSVVEALGNLFLNLILVRHFGLYGVVVATLITRLFCGILWGNSILFNEYFGKEKAKDFYRDLILYFLYAVFCAAFLQFVFCDIISFWDLITAGFVAVISVSLFFVVPYRRTDRFKAACGYFKRIVRMKEE